MMCVDGEEWKNGNGVCVAATRSEEVSCKGLVEGSESESERERQQRERGVLCFF
jgi:hypothetical protein